MVVKPLFDNDKQYTILEVVDITKFKRDFVSKKLKSARVSAEKFGCAKRNNVRFNGIDLNEVFKVEEIVYA